MNALPSNPSEMANEPTSSSLPLEVFTRSTPPGWRPGDARYPLRRYLQLLRLWWHVTDVPEKAAGPAMAARLRGTAFQMAMRITTQRISLDAATGAVTSTPLAGAEALACQSMPEFTHPHTGEVVAAQRAGATLLMHALQAEFLPHNQNLVIAALDQWDTLMIPHGMSRADFLLLFRMGLQIKRGCVWCYFGLHCPNPF